LPPLVDGNAAALELKALLEDNAPYNARVTFQPDGRADALGATGWNAPALAPWLERSVDKSSNAFFGKPACYFGEGGSIPFMGMLGEKFPEAQFLITGVLGPHSNAHGPNEFLHVPYARALTACVASVLADERKTA
jgi:hypothetical protein